MECLRAIDECGMLLENGVDEKFYLSCHPLSNFLQFGDQTQDGEDLEKVAELE